MAVNLFLMASCCLLITTVAANSRFFEALNARVKRQGLGAFLPARTTDQPYIDTDIVFKVNPEYPGFNFTSAPAMDNTFGQNETVAPLPPTTSTPTTLAPTTTTTVKPTLPARMISRNFVFVPHWDFPYYEAKWNGPFRSKNKGNAQKSDSEEDTGST